MAQTLLDILADFTVQLSAPVAIGDTVATLNSRTDDDGNALPNGTYGFTIDGGQSNKEYIVCTLTGTALSAVQSITRQGVSSTGFAEKHRRGAKVSVTDWAILSRMLNLLDGTTGFNSTGTPISYDGSPASLTGNQFITANWAINTLPDNTTFINNLTANTAFQTNVNNFVSGGGGGGGGGGTKIEVNPTQVVVGSNTTVSAYTIAIPANTLGTNNAIRFRAVISAMDIDADNTFNTIFGGQTLSTVIRTAASGASTGAIIEGYIVANAATNAQKAYTSLVDSANDLNFVDPDGTGTVDSTAQQNLVLEVVTAVGGGVTLESIIVEKISSVQDGVIVSMAASEDLTAGDMVGSSFDYPDHVAKAFTAAKTWTVPGGLIANNFTDSFPASAVIDTDKVAYVYRKTGSTTVSVVVVDYATDMTATVGTEEDVTTDILTTLRNYAICKIDTNKFAVFYVEDTDDTNLKGRICTVSGTTITLGAEATYSTSATAITLLAACQLDTGKGFLVNGIEEEAVAFTVSGTTATIGTPATVGGNMHSVVQVATDKAVILIDSTNMEVQACTVSGTTITAGVAQTVGASTGAFEYSSIISPSTDTVVTCRRTSGGGLGVAIKAATISGTVFTFGSDQTNSSDTGQLYSLSASKIGHRSLLFTLSGTTLTPLIESPISGLGSSWSMYTGGSVTVNSRWLLNYGVGSYAMQGTSGNFIGGVLDTATAGSNARVIVSGVVANQSVFPGSYYLVGVDGALSVVLKSTTVNTLDDTVVVKAISATEVVI